MFKSIAKAALAALLIWALSAPMPAARAGDWEGSEMYVSRLEASVYAEPDVDSGVLAILRLAHPVTLLAFDDMAEWVKVEWDDGQTGYLQLDDLSAYLPSAFDDPLYAQSDGVRVYAQADSHSKVIARLKRDESVILRGYDSEDAWLAVEYNGRDGYVHKKYVDTAPWAEGVTMWCREYCVAVTSLPDMFDSIGQLCYGQPIQVLGEEDYPFEAGPFQQGCWRIRNRKGEVGYVIRSALTDTDPNTLNETRYAAVSGKLLFDAFGSGGSRKRMQVSKNAKVSLIAADPEGRYGRVKYNGKTYYCILPLLLESPCKGPCPLKVTAVADQVEIYEKPNLSARVVARVEKGATLRITGGKDDAVKVALPNGSGEGWVHYDPEIAIG